MGLKDRKDGYGGMEQCGVGRDKGIGWIFKREEEEKEAINGKKPIKNDYGKIVHMDQFSFIPNHNIAIPIKENIICYTN